ncbi:MAG: thioredoxin domain-containing protein [Chloroflexota bacterium]
MANRLQNESSPYLRQHAENPVDWYPWGEEALERAQREGKPILLSIGYAACHWCHVMAHESFENLETARVMNDHFVCIKVDREERPDLDSIYMAAVQAMTGQGGWPLTMFLTPAGKPFYGGTYFPPADHLGLPGFRRLLREIAAEYRNKRAEIDGAGERIVNHLAQTSALPKGTLPGPEALTGAYARLRQLFDGVHGGFGRQPKFPQPLVGELLLRLSPRNLGEDALAMVETTLMQMAAGGIYDQLGGGFHRYSVDREWTVPHFEKMLYDNALLARLYLHAYQTTDKPLYRRIATETLDYLRRDVMSPEGGFFASQDADSEGREGAYYVWTPSEVDRVLGKEDGGFARGYFGVTAAGNFEGESILTHRVDDDALAMELRLSPPELATKAERVRGRLLAERQRRVPPGIDTKVLAGWNGLALGAFAEVGTSLGREDYLAIARRNADYLRSALMAGDRLYHSADSREPRLEGFLQDYAFVADGLLALYRATLEGEWLAMARRLGVAMVDRFWSEAEGAFYDSGIGHEGLVLRPRDVYDNAIPSGGAAATRVLYWLAAIADDGEFRRVADVSLSSVMALASRNPLAFSHWLGSLDYVTAPPREVAIVGAPADPATRALLAVVNGPYAPNLVVVGEQGTEGSPLLAGRVAHNSRPTAYYCEAYACHQPTIDPVQLRALLGG